MYSVVGGDGQVYGPVPVETIKEWAGQGRVAGRTSLIDPISGRVLRAEDVDELRDLFLPAPPSVTTAAAARDVPPPAIGQHPFAAPEPPRAPAAPAADGDGPRLRTDDPFGPGPLAQRQHPAPQHSGVGGYPPHYTPQQQYGAYGGVQQAAYAAQPAKSKVAAALLCFFFGMLGVHRFYLGHNGAGIALLLMTLLSFGILWPVTFVWALIDLIMIFTGSLRDAQNRPLAD